MKKVSDDYCEYCSGVISDEEKLVTVYRHRGEKHYIFEAVPARVCKECGERYYSASVAQQMDCLMETPESEVRTIAVPVFSLTPASQAPC